MFNLCSLVYGQDGQELGVLELIMNNSSKTFDGRSTWNRRK